MSLAALTWAADLPMSTCHLSAYRVLLKLADRVDQLGYGAWPGVPSIAETLGCSERTVYRALAELQDLGLIRRGDQRHVAHIDPRYRPIVWDVLTPALRASESSTDIRVRAKGFRGDSEGRSGVTAGVTKTVHNPPTKTSPESHESIRERAYGRTP